MSGQDPVWQYLTGQLRPGFPALLEAYQRESDAMAPPAADIAYGPHARQVFDFIASPAPWRATFAYFHAGYWQSRDKSTFRCIAPGLLRHGIDVALVNYPLCPDVTLPDLVAASREAVPAILAHARGLHRGGERLLAAGHSAGAHLAVELALFPWQGPSPVAGVAALSGVYDLEPLIATPLNDKLRLDPPTAYAMSPLHRVRPGLPPAVFAVGATETPGFLRQNADMHAAWHGAGNVSERLEVAGADHYSILRELQRPSALLDRISAL